MFRVTLLGGEQPIEQAIGGLFLVSNKIDWIATFVFEHVTSCLFFSFSFCVVGPPEMGGFRL